MGPLEGIRVVELGVWIAGIVRSREDELPRELGKSEAQIAALRARGAVA